MPYLNYDHLDNQDAETFRNAHPYPWLGIEQPLTESGFNQLHENLPSLDVMKTSFGKRRRHGQASHDRYILFYREDLPISDHWHAFVEELKSDRYQQFIERMIGNDRFELDFQWHYTPRGCSVSPHCDARWKLGSHLFYFNTESDWSPDWGGDTLILDDNGRFKANSAPAFEDFDHAYYADSIGNRSLLFIRNGNSWHGVREIQAPEGALRKVFLVVVKRRSVLKRLNPLVA